MAYYRNIQRKKTVYLENFAYIIRFIYRDMSRKRVHDFNNMQFGVNSRYLSDGEPHLILNYCINDHFRKSLVDWLDKTPAVLPTPIS